MEQLSSKVNPGDVLSDSEELDCVTVWRDLCLRIIPIDTPFPLIGQSKQYQANIVKVIPWFWTAHLLLRITRWPP